jgi:hypothetical protein
MRKLLAVAMLAAFAVPASAATLGLNFVGAIDDTNAVVPLGGTVTVEVTWTTTSSDDASKGLLAMAFNLTADPEDPAAGLQGVQAPDPGLTMGNNTSALGWSAGGVGGVVGGGAQYGVFTSPANATYNVGTTVLGTFQVTVEAGAALGLHQFYIHRNPAAFTPDPGDDTGASYSFNASGDGYNGFYNIGNGYAGNLNGSAAIPMNINVTPEPAALALLALGGVAVLRRRS